MKKILAKSTLPILISLAIAGCDNFFPDNTLPNNNNKKEIVKLENLVSPKTIKFMDNYQYLNEKKIEKNENYLNYARELQKEYNNFKELRADEIYKYIKYKLNNGKELIEGEIIKLPVYSQNNK
jgi:hypothetical protein